MSVHTPPAELEVRFDLHGARFEVRPRAARTVTRRALLGGLAVLFVGVPVFGVLAVSGTLAWWGPPTAWLFGLIVLGALWGAGTLAVAMVDHARQEERLDVRLGEGWLIVRSAGVVVERVDLGRVTRCAIVRGPDLQIHGPGALPTVLPMRGHELPAVGWVAEAIVLGARDARSDDVPAPPELTMLRAREG